MIAVDLGRIDYTRALNLQHTLAARRSADTIGDVLLLCEHQPVYTAGRNANLGNVLDASAIPLVRADRGGDVTYHGPGQLVAYPIIRLEGARRVRRYVGALEQACIDVAAAHGIRATVHRSRPGVWVGGDKLAAVGVRVTRGSTSHGVALNVDPDLSHYNGIVACGIADGGVCSLRSLGVDATVSSERDRLVAALARHLERPVTWDSMDALIEHEATG